MEFRPEQKEITAQQIAARASELLIARLGAAFPASTPEALKRHAKLRLEDPIVRPWYLRYAFSSLVGERLPSIVDGPHDLARIEARRDQLVRHQEEKGYSHRIVHNGPFMGDDLVFYALKIMSWDPIEWERHAPPQPLYITSEEATVLCAQHSTEVMTTYNIM